MHPRNTIKSAREEMDARTAEAEAIKNDQCENPGCFYSTSESSSCSMVNGLYDCETIRRIFRQCPGKPSVEIFRNEDKKDGNTNLEDRDGGEGEMMNRFFGFGDGNRSREANRNGAVRGIMDDMLGNFFGHRRDGGDGESTDRFGDSFFDEFQRMHSELDEFRKRFEVHNQHGGNSPYQEKRYRAPHRSNEDRDTQQVPTAESKLQERFKEYSKKKTVEL